MKISDAQLEKLLETQTCQDLKNFLSERNMVPSLQQASKLLQHIQSLGSERKKIRLGIIHTYTSELLDPWLHFTAAINTLDMDIYHAPYGVTVQEAAPNSGLVKHAPDITLLLLQREDLHPGLQFPIATISSENREDICAAFRVALAGLVSRIREQVTGQIIVSFLPPLQSPGLGMYDAMAEQSENLWWHQVKTMVSTDLRSQYSGVSYLDLDQLLAQIGRENCFDMRLWYSSAFPFSSEGAFALANSVATLAASLHLTRAKVIVLDADNTLWGGVIGEDGMQGIALGPDYPGKVYVDFQKRLLSLQQRGFILALCSKNNPEDVEEVLRDHPHQVLKGQHFAAQRVNWIPKPDNLKSLAEELNLGLDSFIFVDDSDYECSAVKHALPEVDVVQVPSRAVAIPNCLDALARLEITSLTKEDLEKTALYAQERQRKSQLDALTSSDGSIEDYLRSLNLQMTIGLNDESVLQRLAQLTQKTNQFNLTTRRYTEQDMAQKLARESTCVFHFSLADNFGDSGVVGLAIVELETGTIARLDTFLMSCRVIGRLAEKAFLAQILLQLKSRGISELTAEYIPTRKNILVESFLTDNAFDPRPEGNFAIALAPLPPTLGEDIPIQIQGPG